MDFTMSTSHSYFAKERLAIDVSISLSVPTYLSASVKNNSKGLCSVS